MYLFCISCKPSLFLRYNSCSYDYSLLFKYQFTMYNYMYAWTNPEDTVYGLFLHPKTSRKALL